MRKLVKEGNELTVISSGRALALLRKELGDGTYYIDCPDYPAPSIKNSRLFAVEFMANLPSSLLAINREYKLVQAMVRKAKYDMVVSDNRYGVYKRFMPSFFITHQLRLVNPMRMRMLETGTEIYNQFFFKRYWGVLVPDFAENNLSGDMSHNLRIIKEKCLSYIGPLSDFKRRDAPQDIDYFISITGPEPHRTSLEETLMAQAKDLPGKIVVSLGKSDESKTDRRDNMEVHSYINGGKREELMNRAKLVISWSGYSTLMDVAVLGKKALFMPTPFQPEQEYLSRYHNSKGTFYSVPLARLKLAEDAKTAQGYAGYQRECDVSKAVEAAMDVFHNSKGSPFQ